MSQIIKIKHSTSTGNKPTSLSAGELALNVKDGHFFFGDGSDVQDFFHFGATSARTLSITRELVVTGQTDLRSNLIMNSNRIMSLSDPISAQDAATKAYVDSLSGATDTLQEVTNNGNTTTNSIMIGSSSAPVYPLDVLGDIHSSAVVRSTGLYSTFGTFSANINANGNIVGDGATNITGMNNITATGAVSISGLTSVGDNIIMDMHKVTGMGDPTAAQDAATKSYVDSFTPSGLHYLPLSGGTVTGALNVSGDTALGGDISLIDGKKLKLGYSGDLEIYHNGSNSVIEDTGTGTIFYRSGTQTFQNAAATKTMATFNAANSVDLNYNNNLKFETTNIGINVTGVVKGDTLDIDGNSDISGALNVSGATDIDGTLNLNANLITNLSNPTSAQDGATKAYVDSFTPSGLHYLPLSGGTVTGALNVSGNTEVKGALRARGGLQLGADNAVGNGARIYFGTPGNKSHPQLRQEENNQLILDRGSSTATLVEFNTQQHIDGPAVKIAGDIDLGSGYKLYLDGGTDTYFTDGGVNNTISLYVNNVNIVNFKEVGTLIATPLNVSGATDIDGTLNLNANLITNVTNPTSAQDAATKAYVDQYATSGVSSVAITGTDGIDVDSGSPITSSGTITLGLSSIPNSSLANSSVSYGGVSVSLGAADATPAFNLSDATAYPGDSSLVTTGTITSGVWNNDRLFTLQTAEGTWMGDYVTFGSEVATTAGSLYYYDGSTWTAADASAVESGTKMLGIALGDTNLSGLLIRGMYGLLTYDPGSSGEVLYVSEVAGKVTNTAPTTSAAVVRVVGYAMSDTPQIWFNPDNTWVELS